MTIDSKNYYQTVYAEYKIFGSLASNSMINDNDLLYGRMPSNSREIVIDNFIESYKYCEVKDILLAAERKGEKPFIVILNSVHPMLPDTEKLANNLKNSYGVPVIPVSVENMQEREMIEILKDFKHFGNDRFSDDIKIELVSGDVRISIE